jgi:hypothetical protein
MGVIGLAMGLIYAAAELAPVGWDPAGVIGVGEEDSIRIEYAESEFGREIPLSGTVGHDGRFFFIQSMDPLLLDPDSNAAFLDRPTYRSQRMIYPALVGLASPFGPDAVAWAMIAVNVIAFCVGTIGTARLASSLGLSPWWGLTFAANPGVRFELGISGGGVVAFGAVVWALLFLQQKRIKPAVLAFAGAVLAREVMIVAAAGAALARGVGSRNERLKIFVIPAAVAAGWWVYVHWRVGGLASETTIQEIGIPFEGFIGAFKLWIQAPGIDMVMGITYLALSLLMVVRAVRKQTLIELPAAGFGLLAPLLTRQVWYRQFDISRAVTPVLTLFLLSLAVSLFGRRSLAPSVGPNALKSAAGE